MPKYSLPLLAYLRDSPLVVTPELPKIIGLTSESAEYKKKGAPRKHTHTIPVTSAVKESKEIKVDRNLFDGLLSDDEN